MLAARKVMIYKFPDTIIPARLLLIEFDQRFIRRRCFVRILRKDFGDILVADGFFDKGQDGDGLIRQHIDGDLCVLCAVRHADDGNVIIHNMRNGEADVLAADEPAEEYELAVCADETCALFERYAAAHEVRRMLCHFAAREVENPLVRKFGFRVYRIINSETSCEFEVGFARIHENGHRLKIQRNLREDNAERGCPRDSDEIAFIYIHGVERLYGEGDIIEEDSLVIVDSFGKFCAVHRAYNGEVAQKSVGGNAELPGIFAIKKPTGLASRALTAIHLRMNVNPVAAHELCAFAGLHDHTATRIAGDNGKSGCGISEIRFHIR